MVSGAWGEGMKMITFFFFRPMGEDAFNSLRVPVKREWTSMSYPCSISVFVHSRGGGRLGTSWRCSSGGYTLQASPSRPISSSSHHAANEFREGGKKMKKRMD